MTTENKTYKMIELVGTSHSTVEDAINGALAQAQKTIRHMDWFEVKELRGAIRDGKVSEYQVKFNVGFRIE